MANKLPTKPDGVFMKKKGNNLYNKTLYNKWNIEKIKKTIYNKLSYIYI